MVIIFAPPRQPGVLFLDIIWHHGCYWADNRPDEKMVQKFESFFHLVLFSRLSHWWKTSDLNAVQRAAYKDMKQSLLYSLCMISDHKLKGLIYKKNFRLGPNGVFIVCSL